MIREVLLLITCSFAIVLSESHFISEFEEEKSSFNIELTKVWPEKPENVGEISDVAVRNKSSLFLLHRGDHVLTENSFTERNVFTGDAPIAMSTIVKLVDGKINETFGDHMFFMPHSITLDDEENLWITDIGLHQVVKLNSDDHSKPALVLGQKLTPGNDKDHFCKPTDVAIGRDGSIFVSDGYCNSRIVKYDKNGNYITEWGSSSDETDEMVVPHALELLHERDLLLVADRENGRVLLFGAGIKNNETEGKYFGEITLSGEEPKAYGVSSNEIYGEIYVLGSESNEEIMKIYTYSVEDFEEKYTIYPEENFGYAHEISSCPSSNSTRNENCLAVASLMKNCDNVYDCITKIGMTNETAIFVYSMKKNEAKDYQEIIE